VAGLDFFVLRGTFNLPVGNPRYLANLDFNRFVDGLNFFQFRTRSNTTI
jgi:hypothetical protein